MKDIRNSRQFCYTQQSLSAFENCPLKFKKRYMEGLRWDSLPDKDAKTSLERGNTFHLLARRYFSGIPYGLNESAKDFELFVRWMQSLENYFVIRPQAVYLPEHTLRAELDGLILEANFDLIILEEEHLKIWDWKTHTSKNASNIEVNENSLNNMRTRLEKSLQTMVYMYVLMEQADSFMGKGTGIMSQKGKGTETGILSQIKEFSALSMNYWQPEPPHIIAEINYDAKTHESFRSHLQQLLQRICEYDYSTFDKLVYSRHCKHCEFNWYCNGHTTWNSL